MFLSQEELDRRLKSSKNLANSSCVQNQKATIQPSINIPKVELPFIHKPDKSMQENLVASLVKQGEKIVDISHALNIPISEVKKDSKVDNVRVRSSVDRVRELALDKTMQALGLMTEEKFENANLYDLSRVAANCSRILDATAPKTSIDQRVQFIIHKPESRSLESYKVIDV